jgi:hypothetical protein
MGINKRKGTTPRGKATPERRCVGCREMKNKKDLLRIVRCNNSVDGVLAFMTDETGKAAGRGAYVCKSEDCLSKAVKNKSFERSFKAKLPPNVYEDILCKIKNC